MCTLLPQEVFALAGMTTWILSCQYCYRKIARFRLLHIFQELKFMEPIISRILNYLKNLWPRRSDGLETPLDKLKGPVSSLSIGLNEKSKYRNGPPPKAKNNAFRFAHINGRHELSSFCID